MSNLRTLILHSHVGGPNPWKVAIILEELSLPYEHVFHDFSELKKEPFLALNPNGRVPALEDANTNITLWESGAIIDYLIDQYDSECKLHYEPVAEKYQTRCWEHFQMSGQGPYFGQRVWFTMYHPEKIQSAIDRYSDEIKRVTSVIDSHLKKTGSDYLVGDRVTYADLMFVTWATGISFLAPDVDLSSFETYAKWLQRLVERPAVAKVLRDKQAALSQAH